MLGLEISLRGCSRDCIYTLGDLIKEFPHSDLGKSSFSLADGLLEATAQYKGEDPALNPGPSSQQGQGGGCGALDGLIALHILTNAQLPYAF